MSRNYAIIDQDHFHFVTFTVVYWIDIFIRNEYKDLFLSSVKFCQQEKGLEVGAWCIMTNHVHMILGTNGTQNLESIIRDLKAFTSRHIRKAIESNEQESRKKWILHLMKNAGQKRSNNKDFQLWQQHNHPVELSTNEILDQRLDYIHQNPVNAGFVTQAEDWLYSSAQDYAGYQGYLPIAFLE